MATDHTHDPALRSWVDSAQAPGADFPIQNLPFGVFKRAGAAERPRVGVAIGDRIVDVAACARESLLAPHAAEAANRCTEPDLAPLMALGRDAARALRVALVELLREGSSAHRRDPSIAERILVPIAGAELRLPASIGDYTDFYASIHHATNVGSMFRPDNPLLPNYKYVPIGYHGRASSIVVSGTAIRRPHGQLRDGDAAPVYAPTRRLDYELEVGAFVAEGNALGVAIPIDEAERHLFGLALVNDWSARDIQSWEYQPLGPFLAKNFATTVAPWVVTLDALEPFRVPPAARPEGDPAPLAYLLGDADRRAGAFDITLEVALRTAKMATAGDEPFVVSRGGFTDMYWTVAQLLTHHASNGCNLRPGDLLASGTVSGVSPDSRGCLLERAWRGSQPIALPNGETRAFLHDGDEVIMRGWCERAGAARIGFGECRGRVLAAIERGEA